MNKFLKAAIDTASENLKRAADEKAAKIERLHAAYRKSANTLVDIIEAELERFSKNRDSMISNITEGALSGSVLIKIEFENNADIVYPLHEFFSTCSREENIDRYLTPIFIERGFLNPTFDVNFNQGYLYIDVDVA